MMAWGVTGEGVRGEQAFACRLATCSEMPLGALATSPNNALASALISRVFRSLFSYKPNRPPLHPADSLAPSFRSFRWA